MAVDGAMAGTYFPPAFRKENGLMPPTGPGDRRQPPDSAMRPRAP